MHKTISKLIISAVLGVAGTGASVATVVSQNSDTSVVESRSEQPKSMEGTPICDGKVVTRDCEDEQGVKYEKYVWHDAAPAVEKKVEHPAEPEKSHEVYHEAVYGTRQVSECIKTNINYKGGTCALSQCSDGSYSGSTGRGTCSQHGGVARSGGPWYVYREETYVITPAWTETVVDQPAREAWTETAVVTPAVEAYLEKVPAL